MFAQRSTQLALRRLAISKPSTTSRLAIRDFAVPTTIATSSHQMRCATTQKVSPDDSYQILVEQRRHRPTSPHLGIYRPQIPWILSGLNRLSGVALSGGIYLFGISYLVAPLVGWHLESASLAAAFATWPIVLKIAAKFAVALPFTFHSFNGIRHLIWDTGRAFKSSTVIRTGWSVVGVSVAAALYLATFV